MPWTHKQDALIREALEEAYRLGHSASIEELRVVAKRIAVGTGQSENECLSRMRHIAPVVWAGMKQRGRHYPDLFGQTTEQYKQENKADYQEATSVVDRRMTYDAPSHDNRQSNTDTQVKSSSRTRGSSALRVKTLVLSGCVLSAIAIIIAFSESGTTKSSVVNGTSGSKLVQNRSPTVVNSIEDIAIEDGGEIVHSLKSYFQDPDDDELSYEAVSDHTGIVQLEVSPPNLVIQSVKPGTTNVQVTAADPNGLRASQRFSVEVVAPSPRVLVESDEDVIAGHLSRFFGPIDRSASPIVTIDTTSAAQIVGQIRIVLDRGSLFQAEFDLRLPPVSRVGRDSYEEYHKMTRVFFASFVDNTVIEIGGSDDGLSTVDALMVGIAEKIRAGDEERDAFGATGYYAAGLTAGGAAILLKFSMAGAANPSMDYYVLYISEND